MGSWGGIMRSGIGLPLSKQAKEERREGIHKEQRNETDLAKRLYQDQPVYGSDLIGTYRRTESPVANAYLTSFLTGSNADNVNPLAPNARAQRARAQQSFAQNHGTMASLLARDRALSEQTPWKVRTPRNKSLTKGATVLQPYQVGTVEQFIQRDEEAKQKR